MPPCAGWAAYMLNADSLGMVYDARLAPGSSNEGAPRVIKPTMGPVITATVVHRDDAAHSGIR